MPDLNGPNVTTPTGGDKPATSSALARAAAAQKFQQLTAQGKDTAGVPGQQADASQQQPVSPAAGAGVVSVPPVGGSAEPQKLDYDALAAFFDPKPVVTETDGMESEEFAIAPTDPAEIQQMKKGMQKKFTQNMQLQSELKKELQAERDKYAQMSAGFSQQMGELRGVIQAMQMQMQGFQGMPGQMPGQAIQDNFNNEVLYDQQDMNPVLSARLSKLEQHQQEIQAYREAQQREQQVVSIRGLYRSLVADDPVLSKAGEEVEGFIISGAIAGGISMKEAIDKYRANMRGMVGSDRQSIQTFLSSLPDEAAFVREVLAIAREKYNGSQNNGAPNVNAGMINPAIGAVRQDAPGKLTMESARSKAAQLMSVLRGKGT